MAYRILVSAQALEHEPEPELDNSLVLIFNLVLKVRLVSGEGWQVPLQERDVHPGNAGL